MSNKCSCCGKDIGEVITLQEHHVIPRDILPVAYADNSILSELKKKIDKYLEFVCKDCHEQVEQYYRRKAYEYLLKNNDVECFVKWFNEFRYMKYLSTKLDDIPGIMKESDEFLENKIKTYIDKLRGNE